MMSVALLLAAAAAAPLQPNGNWTVAYEEDHCSASRQFGVGSSVALVTFQPSPLSAGLGITIQGGGLLSRKTPFGRAEVAVTPGGSASASSYLGGQPAGGDPAIVLSTDIGVLSQISDSSILSIKTDKNGSIALQPKGLAKVRATLHDCRLALLKHWGIDPADVDRIAAKATAQPANNDRFTMDDYPDEALRQGQSGTLFVVWKVGTDGKSGDCRVIVSSGVPSLDNQTCRIVTTRFRYDPARDADGAAVVSYKTRRVHWVKPTYR